MTRLMLVADSPILSGLIAGQLQEEGFEVAVLPNCAALIEQIPTTAPDLVILDLTLLDQGGAELTTHLCKRNHIPLIGLAAPWLLNYQAYLCGIDREHLLVKPFGFEKLLSHIDSALAAAGSTSSAA